jgi:hypothetical protein
MKIQVLSRMITELKGSVIYNRYFRAPLIGNHYGSLSRSEIHYVTAIAEVFYPVSTDLEKKQLHETMYKWAEDRTEKDGYFKVYREGIATVEMITREKGYKKAFYELPLKEREQIIDDKRYLHPNIYDKPGIREPFKIANFMLNSIMNQKDNHRVFFFGKMRADIIKGVFSSSLGWEVVGVHPPPGAARDPLAYTRPPENSGGTK